MLFRSTDSGSCPYIKLANGQVFDTWNLAYYAHTSSGVPKAQLLARELNLPSVLDSQPAPVAATPSPVTMQPSWSAPLPPAQPPIGATVSLAPASQLAQPQVAGSNILTSSAAVSSASSWLTQQMITGVPNWALVAAAMGGLMFFGGKK